MDISELFKKAQELQGKMQDAKKELAVIKVEGTAGGGVVKVTANGNQEILNVEVDRALLKEEEKEMLEELIVAAVNQALQSAREESAKYMQNSAGSILGGALNGMNIPGL